MSVASSWEIDGSTKIGVFMSFKIKMQTLERFLRACLFYPCFIMGYGIYLAWIRYGIWRHPNDFQNMFLRQSHAMSHFFIGLCAKILSIRFHVENLESIQTLLNKGPVIFAVNHQSAFETLMCFAIEKTLRPIAKKELERIPLFGTCLRESSITISRDSKGFVELLKKSKDFLSKGLSLWIFPEGIRVLPFERKPLFAGLYAIAKANPGIPIVPVVHNSGSFFLRDSWLKRPGTITMRFLEPLFLRDQTKEVFMAHLTEILHTESDALSELAKQNLSQS